MVGAKFQRISCIVMIAISVLALASLHVRSKSLPHFDACGGAMNSQRGKSRLWPTISRPWHPTSPRPSSTARTPSLMIYRTTASHCSSTTMYTVLYIWALLPKTKHRISTPLWRSPRAKGQGLGCKEEAAVTYQDTPTKGDI